MRLRMWTYDIAREQAPSLENLRTLFKLTEDAGYNAIGLYLEHRFAYASAPWAAGHGVVTPNMVRTLEEEFPDLQIIPFVNLLGHMEGFLYAEQGRKFAEERFRGMQACPSDEGFVGFASGLLDDVLASFRSEIVHLGGDETQQLGRCERCAPLGGTPAPGDRAATERFAKALSQAGPHAIPDHKARLYARHFGPLTRKVIEAGRRPAVWGDMVLEHPKAAVAMPRETLVFDWQYFGSPDASTSRLIREGFEVVCCPSLQTYNAPWMHVPQSEKNVRDHIRAAREFEAFGVCVTTWEHALMGSIESLIPAIRACGKLISEQPAVVEAGSPDPEETRLSFHFHGELGPTTEVGALEKQAPAVRITHALVLQALRDQVDGVRVEPSARTLEVRFEQDGRSTLAMTPPAQHAEALVNRLRLLAGMPIEGRRMLQRGFISGRFGESPFHFDVVYDPSNGPSVVLTRSAREAAVELQDHDTESALLAEYAAESDELGEWAWLVGVKLPELGQAFGHSQTRSSLRVRLLLQSNPFLAWLYHGEELRGPLGDRALALCERAIQLSPDAATQGVAGFIKGAVEFVRFVEQSSQAYANSQPGVAAASLVPARQIFDELEKIARASNLRFGGSFADIERCKRAKERVEIVIRRIKDFGDGSLGYLPSFEHLVHPKFMPHDQGAWWLINRWAHE